MSDGLTMVVAMAMAVAWAASPGCMEGAVRVRAALEGSGMQRTPGEVSIKLSAQARCSQFLRHIFYDLRGTLPSFFFWKKRP